MHGSTAMIISLQTTLLDKSNSDSLGIEDFGKQESVGIRCWIRYCISGGKKKPK